jgi:hypothetical protein
MLDDAELIAGLRGVIADNGGDWGSLKALIKAQIQDERDEAGDGKRVKKILDKADYSAAYADMLGMTKMNENNFFSSQAPHDPKTGEVFDLADENQDREVEFSQVEREPDGEIIVGGPVTSKQYAGIAASHVILDDLEIPSFLRRIKTEDVDV